MFSAEVTKTCHANKYISKTIKQLQYYVPNNRHHGKIQMSSFLILFDVFLASVSSGQSNCDNLPPVSSARRFWIPMRVSDEFQHLHARQFPCFDGPVQAEASKKLSTKIPEFNQILSQVVTVRGVGYIALLIQT